MNKGKLASALVAVVAALAFGTMVLPAGADLRTFELTLLGGQKVTVQVDVPADMPAEKVEFPTITVPILDVKEILEETGVVDPLPDDKPEEPQPEEEQTSEPATPQGEVS